ncbi:MAG: sigma-54 dependent transcriptional regulator, partial [Myxococcota bacterium]
QVLILGENGTGKELAARAIHKASRRAEEVLVKVDLGAIAASLFESELFGHKKGAFTDAKTDRTGHFEAASGGTLFLDEIAEIPPMAQAKLLRVLQEGVIEPLGANDQVHIDVRIVSATHRNLKERIREGLFREDLYYRLNVLDVAIPPLRDRRSDLPLLVEHFIARLTKPGRAAPSIAPSAWAALSEYPFPGNVRELEHAIQRAVVLSRGHEIELAHLPEDVRGTAATASPRVAEGSNALRPLSTAVKEFEHQYLMRALSAAEGKKAKAAELLGISRKNLWEKLRSHEANHRTSNGHHRSE